MQQHQQQQQQEHAFASQLRAKAAVGPPPISSSEGGGGGHYHDYGYYAASLKMSGLKLHQSEVCMGEEQAGMVDDASGRFLLFLYQ